MKGGGGCWEDVGNVENVINENVGNILIAQT